MLQGVQEEKIIEFNFHFLTGRFRLDIEIPFAVVILARQAQVAVGHFEQDRLGLIRAHQADLLQTALQTLPVDRKLTVAFGGDDILVTGKHAFESADEDAGVMGTGQELVGGHGYFHHFHAFGQPGEDIHPLVDEDGVEIDLFRVTDFLFDQGQPMRVGGDEIGGLVGDIKINPIKGIAGIVSGGGEGGFLHGVGKVVPVDKDGAGGIEFGDKDKIGGVLPQEGELSLFGFDPDFLLNNTDLEVIRESGFDQGVQFSGRDKDGEGVFEIGHFQGLGYADFQVGGGQGDAGIGVAGEFEVLQDGFTGAFRHHRSDEGESVGEGVFLNGEFHGVLRP